MGIISRVKSWFYDADAFQKGVTLFLHSKAGVAVSEETAMQTSAVQSAVRLLSETVASLPLHLYKRRGDNKTRADTHPGYALMHRQPNEVATSMVFREILQAHLCLWGNAYARIARNSRGEAIALYPLHPGEVEPEWTTDGKSIIYEVKDLGRLTANEVLHIPGLGFDGLKGKSPIAWAMEQIGASIATDQYTASFFGNSALPTGVLSTDQNLTPDQVKQLNESWKDGRAKNPLGTAVLSGGMKWQQITIPPEDAQFLETRRFQVTEIARIFRVPPHMIGDLERATFSNIEHQGIDFVTYSLRPWLVRWEQELNRKLLTENQTRNHFFEFNVDGLLRGDTKSRYEAYSIGRQWGWLSANDVRRLENMDPVEGGDIYLIPMNMEDANAPEEEEEPPMLPPAPPEQPGEEDPEEEPADEE